MFQFIWTTYYQTIIAASYNTANGLLNGVAPEIIAALSLVVIVVAYRLIFLNFALIAFATYIMRAIIIANLLTAPLYGQFVMTPFLVTIPAALAHAVGVAPNGQALAVTFDALSSGIDHMAAAADAAAGSFIHVGEHVNIFLAAMSAQVMLLLVFLVYMVTQYFVALVVPLGAVLLIFYMFNSTRHIAERWIAKMVTLMVLTLLVLVLTQIVQQNFILFMTQAEALAATSDLLGQIALLKDIALNFAFGLLVLVSLPLLAGGLGGSTVSGFVLMPVQSFGGFASRLSARTAR